MIDCNYVAKEKSCFVLLDNLGHRQRIASNIKEISGIFVHESGGAKPDFTLPAGAEKTYKLLTSREQERLLAEIKNQKDEAYGFSMTEITKDE